MRPKKKKRSSLDFGWEISKIEPNEENFAKLGKFIRKIGKNWENWEISLGKTAGY